jgi:hypothetical protein
MSLPDFSTQAELFSTAGLSASLFTPTDRYRLFAKLVYPHLAASRAAMEKCYCADNGRVALEPVLMLGVSILQDLDGMPDRQAVEMLRYHAGWNFALNRQLGDAVFHPSSLVNFRQRLAEHEQSALGFATILEALVEAGLVSRQSRQRLDSTQMFGRVSKMNRLDCVRESLRLALQELEAGVGAQARPLGWVAWWERSVDSQVDYRTSSETLGRKLGEAGQDAWQLLEWLRGPGGAQVSPGPQVQLLARVFAEQFEVVGGQPAPRAQEKTSVEVDRAPAGNPPPAETDSPGAGSSSGATAAAEAPPGRCSCRGRRRAGSAQGQRTTGFEPGAKSARSPSHVCGQGPRPAQERTCRLQGASGRDGEPSGVSAGRTDRQFYYRDRDPPGL